MLSGLLIVLLPLFLGYLVRVRSTAWLNLINRAVSGSVYLILLFMGVSLAGLENLGSQLSRLGGNALLLFSITTLFNLAALWWLSVRVRLSAGSSPVVKDAPTSKLAAMGGSLMLVAVVAGGVALGLLLGPALGEALFTMADWLAEWVLYVLLVLIGCQLRNSGMPLKQILLNRLGLAIAVTLALSSLLAGLAAAPCSHCAGTKA